MQIKTTTRCCTTTKITKTKKTEVANIVKKDAMQQNPSSALGV